MFESLKYKVWKKLTKKWVRDIKVREAAFTEAARMKTRAQSPPVFMDTSEEEYEKHAVGHQIIDVMSMLYSDSSTVIGTGFSFVKGEGKQRYYFYEFASLSMNKFHEIAQFTEHSSNCKKQEILLLRHSPVASKI